MTMELFSGNEAVARGAYRGWSSGGRGLSRYPEHRDPGEPGAL